MKLRFRSLFAGGVLAVALFGVAMAGPFDDAFQAARSERRLRDGNCRSLASVGRARATWPRAVRPRSGVVPLPARRAARLPTSHLSGIRKPPTRGTSTRRSNVGFMYAQRLAAWRRTMRRLLIWYPQGRRSGERRRAIRPRLDVRGMAKACCRITFSLTCGSTWRPLAHRMPQSAIVRLRVAPNGRQDDARSDGRGQRMAREWKPK